MSAACCLIARVHRNRTITPADKVRAPDLEGCRRAFTSPVSAFECAFWDGTPGLCTRRPDRIPLDRARWVWQSPCGLIKIVTYTGTEFSHIVYNRASAPIGVSSPSPERRAPVRGASPGSPSDARMATNLPGRKLQVRRVHMNYGTTRGHPSMRTYTIIQ